MSDTFQRFLSCEAGDRTEPKTVVPQAPAGWYHHPEMVDTVRYWDGLRWTPHVASAECGKVLGGAWF